MSAHPVGPPGPGAPLPARFPPRPIVSAWPACRWTRTKVAELVAEHWSSVPSRQEAAARLRGLGLLLDWLEDQPGKTWQQRWLASGANEARASWRQGPEQWLARGGHPHWKLRPMTVALPTLIGADVLRPSLDWLLAGSARISPEVIAWRDPEGFERLRVACDGDGSARPAVTRQIVTRCAMVAAAKGGDLAEVTVGDVLEILQVQARLRGEHVRYGSATLNALRRIGVIGEEVPTLREIRSRGPRSAEELVDRYELTSGRIRNLIVDYIKERQAALDYSSLIALSYSLARCFWSDIEAHHRGADTLALPAAVMTAWKQRLRSRTRSVTNAAGETTEVSVERLGYLDVLASVRMFYLDLSEWALTDPARWGAFAVPCPIRAEELSRRKALRRQKARTDARTRARLPALAVLVVAAAKWRTDSAELLAAGRACQAGEQFVAGGQNLTRCAAPHAAPDNIWAEETSTKRRRCLNREEEYAFWAWAIIEVLRLTGLRVEELMELSHHSLVQYRLPKTGELIPLLQIAPSKTDAERLLVVSPELAEVFSAIISRVRAGSSAVPLVAARDYHELVWLPPAPLLFQHIVRRERHGFDHNTISRLIDMVAARSGLADDADATPLRYTPHDFRRMFITDAVMNGLPPHIAQILAGHQDLNVTMGYKAVYPDEAIQAHLAFLARRRALRPSEEYRTPTDEEWQEFLGHFERRKVSIGTCARAFATPCIHEHACVRCPMLWPDPAQRPRIVEICDNLTARIKEAEAEGWLGEVEGLQVSLAGATSKLAQIDRRSETPVELLVHRDTSTVRR